MGYRSCSSADNKISRIKKGGFNTVSLIGNIHKHGTALQYYCGGENKYLNLFPIPFFLGMVLKIFTNS
jgi:hypothetical protein